MHAAVRNPNLPTELWTLILEFASHIPRELGVAEWTADDDQLELGRQTIYQLTLPSSLLEAQMKFRLGMSFVCRLWNRIMHSRGLIYRSVVLEHYDQLQDFLRLLVKSPDIGVTIKRLDIGYPSQSWPLREDGYDSLFEEILEHCPNVVVILDSCFEQFPSTGQIYRDLHGRVDFSKFDIQQLMLHFLDDEDLPSLSDSALCSFNHLRALYLTEMPVSTTSPLGPAAGLSLPYLEILDIIELPSDSPAVDDFFTASDLPSLRSIHVSVFFLDPII
jgi:hypothetical protein